MNVGRMIATGLAALAFVAQVRAAEPSSPQPAETHADLVVLIVDRVSRAPLAETAIDVISEIVNECLVAPCPVESRQDWTGTTDATGLLHIPARLNLPEAIIYVRVSRTEYWTAVYAATRHDTAGHLILRVERPKPKQTSNRSD